MSQEDWARDFRNEREDDLDKVIGKGLFETAEVPSKSENYGGDCGKTKEQIEKEHQLLEANLTSVG
jgi:hypothetical protein